MMQVMKISCVDPSFYFSGEVVTALIPRPVQCLLNKNIKFMAAGTDHSAAVDVSGKLFTFGLNSSGQLGKLALH
jgi:alpha-tubulin suppressor-like RCC1 family protein